jgi:hypothetical protein
MVLHGAAFLTAISEQLYNLLLCGCFTLQMLATSFVPHVGSLLYVAQTSWLYAFKCFDYKWSSESELGSAVAWAAFLVPHGLRCRLVAGEAHLLL